MSDIITRVKSYLDPKSIVIYIVIIVIFWYAWKSERLDMNCADKDQKTCGAGKGRAYYNSRGLESDDVSSLVGKLNETGHYDSKGIYWRRSMIEAIIASIIVICVVERAFPKAQKLGICVIIIFLISYSSGVFHQNYVVKPAEKQMDDTVKLIKMKF
jgi:hypothetical protein